MSARWSTPGGSRRSRDGVESDDLASLVERLHARLVDDVGRSGIGGSGLGSRIDDLIAEMAPVLGPRRAAEVVRRVVARASGTGPIEDLLADAEVTEVMINAGGVVWVERAGRLERSGATLTEGEVSHLIERIVAPLGLRVDRAHPIVDARLGDGSRVNVVVPPLAIDGPSVTIRRFGARPVTLGAFAPDPVVELLREAVEARMNIVVSGGTGAGKTTLLNALAGLMPPHDRIVTIEDAAELRLPGDHVVRLESRPANADGFGAVPVRDLVRNALRMRPDRIIVGEVRGPEALDMVQAMNTGHEGSMSTCHANSPDDAISRLETMALQAAVGLPSEAVRRQIAASIDLVVQVVRTPEGRKISQVAEIDGRSGAARSLIAGDGETVARVRRPRRHHQAVPEPRAA